MEHSWILYIFPCLAVFYTTFFFGYAGVSVDDGKLVRGWVNWLLGAVTAYAFIAMQLDDCEPYVKTVVRHGNFLHLVVNVVASGIITGIGYVSLEALTKGTFNGRKR